MTIFTQPLQKFKSFITHYQTLRVKTIWRGKMSSNFSTQYEYMPYWILFLTLPLQIIAAYLRVLNKLQGKAVTYFCEVEWWRTLMVGCVTVFWQFDIRCHVVNGALSFAYFYKIFHFYDCEIWYRIKYGYTFYHQSSPPFNFTKICNRFSLQLT